MRAICLYLMLAFLPLLPRGLHEYHVNGNAQGTTYHITYYAPDSLFTQRQADSIFDKLDSSLSEYKTHSLISRFNASATGILMDGHLRKVARRSLDIWRDTNGESDITVAPLVQAWGFGPHRAAGPPDSAGITTMLACVGAEKLHISGNRLLKDKPCVAIDVNGIAQGYSVDVVAAFLESRGIGSYLVEVGGEIRVKGQKPSGKRFTIGIESPGSNELEEPVVKKLLRVDHGGITTSGNYRKFYTSGKKIISHLIEPHTGYPIQNEMISVTVYAPDAITADGYDNALMAMGLQRALRFVAQRRHMEAYFIYRKADGSVADTATAGFARMLVSGPSGSF